MGRRMNPFTEAQAKAKLGKRVKPSREDAVDFIVEQTGATVPLRYTVGAVVGIEADPLEGWNVVINWDDGAITVWGRHIYEKALEEIDCPTFKVRY